MFRFKNECHYRTGNLQKYIISVYLTPNDNENLAGLVNFDFNINSTRIYRSPIKRTIKFDQVIGINFRSIFFVVLHSAYFTRMFQRSNFVYRKQEQSLLLLALQLFVKVITALAKCIRKEVAH